MAIKKVAFAVLGAGISGLSFAHFLQGKDLVIVEKQEKAGGLIQKTNSFENGPHIFQAARSASLIELIETLGLKDKMLFSSEDAKARFVLDQGQFLEIPSSFKKCLFSPLGPLLAKALFRAIFAKKKEGDETIEQFCTRRFGKELTQKLIDPMARGIWAGEISKLSLAACLPSLKKLEDLGSIVKGLLTRKNKTGGLFTLKEGMSSLCLQLQKALQDQLLLNTQILAIKREEEGFIVQTNQGIIHAKQVISALPLSALKHLMKSYNEQIYTLLESIPLQGLKMVNLRYAKPLVLPKGFGYLVPSFAQESIMGVIFDSLLFEKEQDELTVLLKEEGDEEAVYDALKRHLGITQKPQGAHSTHFPDAIPQYVVGHLDTINALETLLAKEKGLHFLGNFLYGVSVNDCIQRAKVLAKRLESL